MTNKFPSLLLCLLLFSANSLGSSEYNRKLYKHWIDADKDCQNTRQEVLIAESLTEVVFDSSGCKVIGGKWYDDYTDQYFYKPNTLDIDHLIPLKEAHISGGFKWDAEKRKNFANNIYNPDALIAVYRSANRSKGSKDPANWMPPNAKFHCDYVKKWVKIKVNWKLSMDKKERRSIKKVLKNCR